MNRMISAAITALFCAAPVQAQQEHGRFDFPFTVNGQEHVLTYEGTHDVMRQPDPAVKLVVFVHHGGSQNPVTYFKHMKTALDAAAADSPGRNLPGTTMIIAPGMIGEQHIKDNPKRYAGKNYRTGTAAGVKGSLPAASRRSATSICWMGWCCTSPIVIPM